MHSPIVGLDLGHSAVKLTYDTPHGVRRDQFPALACPALPLRDAAEAKLAALETVSVGAQSYFVGTTAAVQGKAVLGNGLTDEWLGTPAHTALLAHALQLIERHGVRVPCQYVLGLPVTQYLNGQAPLRAAATAVLGQGAELVILPQPLGAYYAHLLDRDGLLQDGRSLVEASWAVIDVGYYSTDIVLLQRGRWVEAASGGCAGVRLAVESLQRRLESEGMALDLVDTEQALINKTLRYFGEVRDIAGQVEQAAALVANKVADLAGQLLAPHVQGLDGVLVTGGGTPLVLPTLQRHWPHARRLEDTHTYSGRGGDRFLISEGYYRHGRSRALLKRAA